jgi:hypothetical protein
MSKNSGSKSTSSDREICSQRYQANATAIRSVSISKKSAQGCFHCLELGHWVRNCPNKIRCRFCYLYGHIKRACYSKRHATSSYWRPKAVSTSSVASEPCDGSLPEAAPSVSKTTHHFTIPWASSPPPPSRTSPASPQPQAPLLSREVRSTMANFLVDPMPFIPLSSRLIVVVRIGSLGFCQPLRGTELCP